MLNVEQLEEDIKLLKEMKKRYLNKEEFFIDNNAEKKAQAIDNIIKAYNDLLLKNLKTARYTREWIEAAEKDWCADINDYIGISGLYIILEMLEED